MLRFLLCVAVTCCCLILRADENSPLIRVAVLRDIPKFENALTAITGREYDGTIEVSKDKIGNYFAVNTLDLEDYLLGVIGQEMNPNAPLEALKAQAIAARSHALYLISISEDQPYDLVANLSQAYSGKTKLSKNVVIAIEATRGQVLYYLNKPIPAYFHDSCGGHTESVETVWQSKKSDLKLPPTAACPFCAKSLENKWRYELSVAAFQKLMKQGGYTVGNFPSVSILEKGIGGHALSILIRSQSGDLQLQAEKFRSILGYHNLKSTLFQISCSTNSDGTFSDKLSFQGDGFGHGVGMCQYGAQQMAQQGSKYNAILDRYFPNCKIQPFHPGIVAKN